MLNTPILFICRNDLNNNYYFFNKAILAFKFELKYLYEFSQNYISIFIQLAMCEKN